MPVSRAVPAIFVLALAVAASAWIVLAPDGGDTTLASSDDELSTDAAAPLAGTADTERMSVAPRVTPQTQNPRDRAGTLEIQLRAAEPGTRYVHWVLVLQSRDRREVRPWVTGFGADGRAVARVRESGWYSVASLEDSKGRSIWHERTGAVDPWFEVKAGQRTRIDLRILRSGVPVGYVAGFVHVDGHPAAGIAVTHDLPRRLSTLTTDAQGHFDLGPVYRFQCELRVDSLHWAGIVHLEAGRQKNLFIDIYPGTIRGVVVDTHARPVASRIEFTGLLRPGPGFTAASVAFTTRTDPKGCFVANRLPPGTYRITVRRRRQGGGVRDVHISAGVVRDVRVLVQDVRNLRGTLTIPWLDFKRHKTAPLAFSGPADEHVLLSPSGRFRVEDLVPGTYRVSLALGDLEENFVELELIPSLLVGADAPHEVERTVQRPRIPKLGETLHRFGFGLR